MTTPAPQSLSGLASILSSEPMPQMPMLRTTDPVRIANEVELYVRNLHIYLTRLFGRFTATNILTTINQGGSTKGFQRILEMRLHYIASSNETPFVTIDTGFDWRSTTIVYSIRTDTSIYASDLIDVNQPDGQTNFIYPVYGTGYPTNLQTGPNNVILRITSTGNLQIGYVNTSGILDLEFYIFIGAMGSVKNTMPTVRFGNAS